MLDPKFKLNKKQSNSMSGDGVTGNADLPLSLCLAMREDTRSNERQGIGLKPAEQKIAVSERDDHRATKLAKRRSLPKNFLLKRLDTLYWKRLLRYFYIRFLRMRSSPRAIARGMAAGAFAGSFPLLGMQTIVGVAIASCIRGNKVVAAASTWISNPLTYVPLFALNFHIGRRLLRLPKMDLPSSTVNLDEWTAMGMDVAAALMLGSFIVGIIFSIVGYYVGLRVAQRVRSVKAAKAARKNRRLEKTDVKN